jgi:hypothetical protein
LPLSLLSFLSPSVSNPFILALDILPFSTSRNVTHSSIRILFGTVSAPRRRHSQGSWRGFDRVIAHPVLRIDIQCSTFFTGLKQLAIGSCHPQHVDTHRSTHRSNKPSPNLQMTLSAVFRTWKKFSKAKIWYASTNLHK